jgi:hypothetical protein
VVVFGTTENRMASSIDSTKPATGSATTSSVRDNFALAKAEINELMRATEDIVTAAGTADALTADFVTNVVLAEGVTICIKAASANTSATPTLNVDGTGAKTIVKDSGAVLGAGDIAGSRHRLIFKYDASNSVWILINPAVTVLTVGASLYPVGSIYTNAAVATNPATLLGFGTWTAFGAGRVMVGLDGSNALFDTLEETGGSADINISGTTDSHALTIAEMPSHNHPPSGGAGVLNQHSGYFDFSWSGGGTAGKWGLDPQGGGQGHTHGITFDGTDANYQPFITVYMWKRTA